MFNLLPSVVLNTLPLCRFSVAHFPFTDPPSQIPRCKFPHRICPCVNCHCICPCVICLRTICFRAICLCTSLCADPSLRVCLRSTLGANFIARLCQQSTRGQTSSHGFACAPPLVEGHRMIYPWPFGESLLTNLSSPDQLPTDPRSALPFPRIPPAL